MEKNVLVYNNQTKIAEKMGPLFAGEELRMLVAADVRQLYDILKSAEIHLLLVDVELNDKGWDKGIEMIASLRRKSTIPLIVVSAQSAETAKIMALEAGADDYSVKPIKAIDLISRIKVHLQYFEKSQYYESHDKGISRVTLQKIEGRMRECDGYADIDTLEECTQIKKKTLYRYLQYLVKEGMVEQEYAYGDMGRPRTLYKWK